MAYVIKVLREKTKWPSPGWISAYGYTTASNILAARKFESREAAESFALILTTKLPHYIQKLKVVSVVYQLDKKGNPFGYEEKENGHGSVLR